jgi:hypothetical protein
VTHPGEKLTFREVSSLGSLFFFPGFVHKDEQGYILNKASNIKQFTIFPVPIRVDTDRLGPSVNFPQKNIHVYDGISILKLLQGSDDFAGVLEVVTESLALNLIFRYLKDFEADTICL